MPWATPADLPLTRQLRWDKTNAATVVKSGHVLTRTHFELKG